jgi:hypothetical protein
MESLGMNEVQAGAGSVKAAHADYQFDRLTASLADQP